MRTVAAASEFKISHPPRGAQRVEHEFVSRLMRVLVMVAGRRRALRGRARGW